MRRSQQLVRPGEEPLGSRVSECPVLEQESASVGAAQDGRGHSKAARGTARRVGLERQGPW